MQQILAYETDLLEYGDIFDGSPAIAAKVAELKREALEELAHIEAMGGAVVAVEQGYMKHQLVESNTRRVEAIERGEQTVVGVNRFVESEDSPLSGAADAILTVSPHAEADQIERLKAWRASRDQSSSRVYISFAALYAVAPAKAKRRVAGPVGSVWDRSPLPTLQ